MDVIYLPISENFTAEDQALMSFVSRRRAESIGRFHRGSDRKTSLYATLLVIMYLQSHCDIPAGGPRFEGHLTASLTFPDFRSVSAARIQTAQSSPHFLSSMRPDATSS